MGGCCCCPSRRAELDRRLVNHNNPQEGEHETLSDTSALDAYQAPPAPLPFVDPPRPMVEADGRFERSDTPGALYKSDFKINPDPVIDSSMLKEDGSRTSDETFASATDDEDVCPICLEEYDNENPRILTKCEHHFHLSCILEWMERSDNCPICDEVMVIENASNG